MIIYSYYFNVQNVKYTGGLKNENRKIVDIGMVIFESKLNFNGHVIDGLRAVWMVMGRTLHARHRGEQVPNRKLDSYQFSCSQGRPA